jgi:serine/threonine protein phosphatase PrpC
MLRVAQDSFAKTDTGRQRRSNEDRVFDQAPLFAVADGMGGARAGEVASTIVVDTFTESQALPGDGSVEERLATVVREANARIHELAQADADRAGMGTTVTAAYVGDDAVSFAHVGDSRAYRWRDGKLERLTTDHSLVEELKRRGRITEQEAEDHPQKSVITRALGPEAAVEVDTLTYPAQPEDAFLLCSDGLTGMVPEDRIAEILAEARDLPEAGQALIREANERGGRDNITVVLFRLEEVNGSADPEVDRPTEIGVPAPTPEQVAEARADASPTAPRRTMPLPRREQPADKARRPRRRIRGVGPALVVLAIAAVLGAGAWVATRAVYFVGTDSEGIVTIYRGLPYDGPGGVDLYQGYYKSGVPASELSASRRKSLLDHQLRSRDDVTDLVRKLELGQVTG